MFKRMPFQIQHDLMDCGPSCLKMITEFYGREYSLEYLRELCFLSREGVSLLSINNAAEKLGFRTMGIKIPPKTLIESGIFPCIIHWNQDHFIVLYGIKRKNRLARLFSRKDIATFIIADPSHGIVKLDEKYFLESWISTVENEGVVLILEPTPYFFQNNATSEKKKGYSFLFQYLTAHRKYIFQVILGMVIATFYSLLFPFLTRALIDDGVANKSLPVVYLILLSQLFIFSGNAIIEFIRSWLLLHINTRISLNIISDFLNKLFRLPMKFFDTKAVGDLSQRIGDHHRIEDFLTGSTLSSLFSIVNIILFSVILAYYDWKILITFALLTIFAVGWLFMFMKKRKKLDYKRFSRNRENTDKMYEMINGMQEIKLYGSETSKRWEWEQLQVKYFKLNIKSLTLEQYQNAGFLFFTHLKNILISFIAASETIKGNMSFGELVSVSFVIGQTNGPIGQLFEFIKSAQDAKVSMERLQEVHDKADEEVVTDNKITDVPHRNIHIKNVTFQYEGPGSPLILNDINLVIPKGKVTAIVGTSGSGKTTLIKLLLGFYKPGSGEIKIGDFNLNSLSPKLWRAQCGTVMQEGYIFSDTIARNIALDGKEVNEEQIEKAVNVANLDEFIKRLPLGFTTKIGVSGIGLSGGERQRVLIARSVYKNPDYLFFDEATSSLDANNETIIMNNLEDFFKGKTVIIIAHRLSTVKNADQIIVLEKGKIVETGNHQNLVQEKGRYYKLIKNQLELGV